MNFDSFDDPIPAEPDAAALAAVRARAARRRARRRALAGAIAAAVVAAIAIPTAFAFSSDGDDGQPGQPIIVDFGTTPPEERGIVMTIQPDESVVEVGDAITGVLRFDNRTDSTVTLYRCTLAYRVLILDSDQGPGPVSADECRPPLALPPGITEEKFRAATEYANCRDDVIEFYGTTCLANGEPPLYPPGDYQLAVAGPSREGFQLPDPIAVRIVRGNEPPNIADLEISIMPLQATLSPDETTATRWLIENPTGSPIDIRCFLDEGAALLAPPSGPRGPRAWATVGGWSSECDENHSVLQPGAHVERAGPDLTLPDEFDNGEPVDPGVYEITVTHAEAGVKQPEPFRITVTD